MKDKISKNQKSLVKRFSSYFLATLIVAIVLFFILINLGMVYLISKSNTVLIILSISLPVFLIVLILLLYITIRSVYSTIFNKILPKTVNNYKAIYDEKKILDDYGLNEYKEIQDINNSITKINSLYQNINILNNYLNYSHIPLEYYSKEFNTITDVSFKDNIKEIIACSQSFRNAIVRIDYGVKNAFDAESIKDVIVGINAAFPQPGLLIALFDERDGLFVYIPKVTAISLLKEKLSKLFDFLTITQKTINGTELYSPKINAVIYPYSPIGSIFNDLRYISTQDKRLNVYIPNRIAKQENDSILHSTMNLNAMNKFISSLSNIARKQLTTRNSIKEIGAVMEDLVAYLSLNEAGIVLYDDDTRAYYSQICIKKDEDTKSLYPSSSGFPTELIREIEKEADDDGSYYFANRDDLQNALGRMNDIYGVSSGFYFVSNIDNGIHKFLIYFVNSDKKPFVLDSYIRESLLMTSSLIGAILTVSNTNNKLALMKSREDNLYKVTKIKSYNVNRNTYEILDYSKSLKEVIPSIEVGMKCYKAIFGIDKPCEQCPLISRQKIIKEINGLRSEVSYSVNNKLNNQVELLVSPLDKDEAAHNRFEPDLGVGSLYSLTQRVDNFFLTRTKGYLVVVSIDNINELTTKLGGEGYSLFFRLLTEEICLNVIHGNELYYYKNDAFIIILPEVGKLDVVDAIEEIYAISKKNFIHSSEDVEFKFAYSAVKFPQQFNNTEGVVRHIETLLSNRDMNKLKSDYLYVEENDFYRPASKTNYILNIIDDAAANNKFIIKTQPIVVASNKHIDNSELLIRLSDTYRDSMLNTDELIKIAAKNNKLNLISDLLINYVCKAYDNYGKSIFKPNNFKHISINADYAYFIQDRFAHNLKKILSEHEVPDGFVLFEVAEYDLAAHYNEFMSIIPEINRGGCGVVCDRYTSQHLSCEKLRELGVKAIKTDRYLANDIDINSDKFTAISKMITNAKEHDLKICIVGVENSQQYKLIKEIDSSIFVQGYYLYHPFDIKDLVDSIKRVTVN